MRGRYFIMNDEMTYWVSQLGMLGAAVRFGDRKDHGGDVNQNCVSNAAFFSRSSRSKEAR